MVENLGIHVETVETHPDALGYSVFQPMSKAFESQMEKGIENTYSTFKQRVAEGRNLDESQVETLAQGRVWTGKQAVANGLIDSISGLQETVIAAAKLVHLENYNQIDYPKFEESLASVFSGMSLSVGLDKLWKILLPNQFKPQWNNFQESNPAARMQLLLPYELTIH